MVVLLQVCVEVDLQEVKAEAFRIGLVFMYTDAIHTCFPGKIWLDTDKRTDRQTDEQTDRRTNRQTDEQTDRQSDV